MMKWISSALFLILLGMIYWSSHLVERDIKKLHLELKSVKEEIKRVQFASPTTSTASATRERPYIDSHYPNLLVEDLFFLETLSKLVGASFIPTGIRKEALLGHPEHLHPFNHFRDISSFWSLCTVTLAENQFGKYEVFTPAAAIKIEERPRQGNPLLKEYWVHLREGIFWEPLREENFPSDFSLSSHFLEKHPLTAHDFKFYFDAVMNPHVSEAKAASLRTYWGDVESFEVIDDLTFVVRWKGIVPKGENSPKIKYTAFSLTCAFQPLPSFLYQYFPDGKKIVEDDSDPDTYRKNSVWAQNFSHHFAKNIIPSCGAWIFWQMNDEGIIFKRNPSFYNRFAVLVEELHYLFKQTPEAVWQDLKIGSIDLCQLAPSQLPELERFIDSPIYKTQVEAGRSLKELDFVEPAYYYVGWNEKTPYFESKNTRLAMTLSIDRNKIISQNLNDMGIPISGPFFRYSPSYDASIEPWPYNPEEAKRLLTEEGWIDIDGDGIREKKINGKKVPFVFSLIYYAKNLSTKAICEYMATSLREVGVQANIRGLDITDLSHCFEDKTFDAIFFGWALGTPPEDPKQLWYSSGAGEKGSSNAIGFANHEIDQIIDELHYEYDKEKRLKLYHRFHRIIHDEAPYTFLYSPKRQLLYREYVKNVFIPRDRQDLCPGAVIPEPDLRVIFMSNAE
jgi:peptide/nickel transport system substrate-binding protein